MKQNVNKRKRMEGVEYLGISKTELYQKPRQLGEPCSSLFCVKSAVRKCSTFNESTRKEIFGLFWEMSWEQKRQYVAGLTSFCETKRKTSENSRRNQSISYFLSHNSKRLQVCREMFYSTLGVKEKMVRNWISSAGKHGSQCNPDNALI